MEYTPEVARRFDSSRGVGELAGGTQGLVTGEAEDRALHVWVRFQLQVTGGTVREARFAVFGCPHTIAAASRVAELLEGRPRAELAKLDMRKVQAELGVPIEKLGKLLRIEDALAGCGRALDKDVTHGVTKDDD